MSDQKAWVTITEHRFRECTPDYLFPSQPSIEEISTETINPERLPFNTLSVRFYTVVKTSLVVNGERLEMMSRPVNVSKRYFITGAVFNLDQLADEPISKEILRLAKAQGATRVLRTKQGRWHILGDDDFFVEALADL